MNQELNVVDLDTDPREFMIYGHHPDEAAYAAVEQMVGESVEGAVSRRWVRLTKCDAERCSCEGAGHIERVERGTPGALRVTFVTEMYL